MVLAAIAQGLSPQISNTVLTRRLHDTPAREEYEYLSVQPLLEPGAGTSGRTTPPALDHVLVLEGCIVTGLDVVCSLGPLRRLSASRISFTCTSRCRWA